MSDLNEQDTLSRPENISPRNTGIRHGVILALIALAIQLITYVMGWSDNPGESPGRDMLLGVVSLGATIAVILMAVRSHREELGGFISFGRAMLVCFWMGIIYGLITAVWTWLYSNVVAPDTFEKQQEQIDLIRAQVEDGEAPEMALTFIETMVAVVNNPIAITISSLLSILFFGLFVSLFAKRERPLV